MNISTLVYPKSVPRKFIQSRLESENSPPIKPIKYNRSRKSSGESSDEGEGTITYTRYDELMFMCIL